MPFEHIVNDITTFCFRLLQKPYTVAPARPKTKFLMSLTIHAGFKNRNTNSNINGNMNSNMNGNTDRNTNKNTDRNFKESKGRTLYRAEEEKITPQELIAELPKGLVKWYPFRSDQCALYITGNTELDRAVEEALRESGMMVDCVEAAGWRTAGNICMEANMAAGGSGQENIVLKRYDHIIITTAIEQTGNREEATEILRKAKTLLKEHGRLFLGMNNRLGIRYFCGDKDPYTGRSFDGVEGYVRAEASAFDRRKGRSYAKAEIRQMLREAGFLHYRFYSVFPVLERPQIMFADDFTPGEQLDIRIFPQYHCADTVFLEEELLYGALLENGMFHPMANAFFIECALDGGLSDINQITVSMDRGRENAMFTMIRRDGRVVKKPVYREGMQKGKALKENAADLERHGVRMVPMELENDACVMPFIKERSALSFLRELSTKDQERFLQELDRFWQIILHSSEHTAYEEIDWENYAPGWEEKTPDDPLKDQWKKLAFGTAKERDSIGVILKRGYIDLIPLNAFYDGEDYLFYDQEMYVENLPAKSILLRTLTTLYLGNWELERILPEERLRERYGLNQCRQLFSGFNSRFLNELRNDRTLRAYHRAVRKNAGTIHANRQRMNYAAQEYDRIFRDIFKGTQNRRLYLFGTGQFGRAFLSQFGRDCEIAGFIDNDPDKWNTQIGGVPVYPPAELAALEKGTYKVIICIKNHRAVMEQLTGMGITNFSVYDVNLAYVRPVPEPGDREKPVESGKKKYHVGYVAGVFDLFHIGHLNLLRRAKEQCSHLIVGVVTDEGVIRNKHKACIVPFAERIEIVRACRYVDEAVEIPLEQYDTDEAYRRYQFDVQFSGSDYADSPAWTAKREFLRQRGANLVFFPYTQSTSSTKRRELIGRKAEE